MAEIKSLSDRLAQIRTDHAYDSPMNVELRCLREVWDAEGAMYLQEVYHSLCYLIDVYVVAEPTVLSSRSDEDLKDTSLLADLLIDNFSKGRFAFFQSVLRVCKERGLE